MISEFYIATLVQSWVCDVGDALSVGFQGECTMHEWLWRSWLREVGDGCLDTNGVVFALTELRVLVLLGDLLLRVGLLLLDLRARILRLLGSNLASTNSFMILSTSSDSFFLSSVSIFSADFASVSSSAMSYTYDISG